MTDRRTGAVCAALIVVFMSLHSPACAQDKYDIDAVVSGTTGFALELYAALSTDQNNVFFSPYSAYSVLALMYGGARGTTAEQLEEVLGITLDEKRYHAAMTTIIETLDAISSSGAIELNVANGLWPQSGSTIDKKFLDRANQYQSTVQTLDYRKDATHAKKLIDAWAQEKTNGKIDEIITWALHPETHLLLTNAIYFKGNWASQFAEEDTEEMAFSVSMGVTPLVEMMVQEQLFEYGENEFVQVLELPYEDQMVSMTILLPKDPYSLEDIQMQLTAPELDEWMTDTYGALVHVFLPKFTLRTGYDLIPILEAMGLDDAVSGRKADFSGVGSPANWFYINKMVQQAFVAVNEEGTEAAAVTVGGCFPGGTPVVTPSGLLPIAELSVGDSVVSFDVENGTWENAIIVDHASYDFSEDMITLIAGDSALEATWNHPFMVVRGDALASRPIPADLDGKVPVTTQYGRWVEARHIRVGDELLSRSGLVRITEISKQTVISPVYALNVEPHQTYAVGSFGLLVHNQGKGESAGPGLETFRADHPFLFFIRDRQTGTILFMGRIVYPVYLDEGE